MAADSSLSKPLARSAFRIAWKLPRAGVADKRAAKAGEARPIRIRRRAALVFVAADEGDSVAGTRVGERDTRITCRSDRGGNARNDLERYPVLMKEQRFLPAAIEHERIAPLQTRHNLAFTRFLDEQVVDGFLIERLRRRKPDVDLLGVLARIAKQPRMDEMIVEHDVGGGEMAKAAYADESRIAGSCADEVDDGSHLCQPQGFGIRD